MKDIGYFIEVKPDAKLFIEDIGSGIPVLMIHGWPINHKMFEYQMNVLPAFGIRMILPDLRGFGNSDRPCDGYSYNRMADDIKSVVDVLQLDQFTLLGFSMGGAIAIRYMSRHGGYKVKNLILAGAAAPSFTQRDNFPYGMPLKDIDPLIRSLYLDRPKTLTEFGRKFFGSAISEEFTQWFNDLGFEASGHGTIKSAFSLRNEDLRKDLKRILVRTYILHGRKDKICPYELAIEMKKTVQNSKLIPFVNSGHGLFYDEWQKFNHEITNIILSHEGLDLYK